MYHPSLNVVINSLNLGCINQIFLSSFLHHLTLLLSLSFLYNNQVLSCIFYFRDFKSSRYSHYNNLLQLKSVHRFNKVVEIKSSFDYGRTYISKVNKQRATVNAIAKYNFKKNGASVNYNVSIGYQPAVSLHIYLIKIKKSNENLVVLH